MAGARHADIARVVGVSVPTLRKAFREELQAARGGAGLFDPALVPRIAQEKALVPSAGGRRPFQPSEYQRRQVMELAAVGRPVRAIARALGFAEPTLRKHFAAELETGAERIEAEMLKALMSKARGGNVAAQKQVLQMIGAARLERMEAVLTQSPEARPDTPGKKLQAAIDAADIIQNTPILAHLRPH
jgi:AcrR family transcriptional regulator